MLTLSIALLFSVAALYAVLVLAQSVALAVPAWRETRAALDACPPHREALVTIEYRFERAELPRGRRIAPRPAPARRRAPRSPLSSVAA